MRISQETIQKILSVAKVEEVIADFCKLERSGASLYTTCPKCGKSGKGKGLIVTPSQGIYKCFHCEYGERLLSTL